MKITLDDLLEKSAEEVIQKIEKKEDRKMTKEKPNSQVESSLGDKPQETAPVQKFDKKQLKGLFKEETVFEEGQKIQLEGVDLSVDHIESSAGRIRFKVVSTGEVFSISEAVLKGRKEELPYKKGVKVIFKEQEYEVKGLNPASRNVVLEVDGKLRYVKISKIRPVGQ